MELEQKKLDLEIKKVENGISKQNLDNGFEKTLQTSKVFQRVSKRQRLGSPGAVKHYYTGGLTLLFPLFRETELPTITKLWGIKLKPSIWALILRCLWFGGYSRGCESLSNAKGRAKKASELLVKYAQEHTSVVLIGHGFFNMLIAEELQKTGWKGKRKTSSKHWNCTTYSFFN